MNSLYPILRKVLVQVTKIATTVLLLIVLIDYFEKLIAFKFESVYEGTDGYYYLYTPISFTIAEYIQISFITSLFLLILIAEKVLIDPLNIELIADALNERRGIRFHIPKDDSKGIKITFFDKELSLSEALLMPKLDY